LDGRSWGYVITDSASTLLARDVWLYMLVLELASAESFDLDFFSTTEGVGVFASSSTVESAASWRVMPRFCEAAWGTLGTAATLGNGAPSRLKREPESGISGMVSIAGNGWCGEVGGVERDSEVAAEGGDSISDSLARADADGDGSIASGSPRAGGTVYAYLPSAGILEEDTRNGHMQSTHGWAGRNRRC
jgi:hypothetical protein